jgi:hypothetical protein
VYEVVARMRAEIRERGDTESVKNKTAEMLTTNHGRKYKCHVVTLTGITTGEKNGAGTVTYRQRAGIERKDSGY